MFAANGQYTGDIYLGRDSQKLNSYFVIDQETSYTTTITGCNQTFANCTGLANAYNDTDSMDYKLIQNPERNITLEYDAQLGQVIGNPTNDTICLSNNSICLGDS